MHDQPDAQTWPQQVSPEYDNQPMKQSDHNSARDVTKKDFWSDQYNMSHRRRGTALIINNRTFDRRLELTERTGTDRDASALNNRFAELGFDVKLYHNLTKKKMLAQMKAVAEEDYSDADCFICAILTHGLTGDQIFGTDGPIEIKELTEPFNGRNCRSLVMKPKIFFIQACQGFQMDEGVNLTVTDAIGSFEEPQIIKIPTEADFLICQSSIAGYYSWRNSNAGSWYVQALSDVLEKHGQEMELVEMLTMVNRKVAFEYKSKTASPQMDQMKQIPCFTSMLTKKVYFPEKDD